MPSQSGSDRLAILMKLRPLFRTSLLRRANITPKLFRFGLDLFQPLLHDITDANDAVKFPALNYGQMPDTLQRHHPHDINKLVLACAGLNLTGHQLMCRKCQHRFGVLRHAADDVALGDDPNELTSLVDNRNSSDPVLGEYLDDPGDGLLGRDGDYIMTFVLQD